MNEKSVLHSIKTVKKSVQCVVKINKLPGVFASTYLILFADARNVMPKGHTQHIMAWPRLSSIQGCYKDCHKLNIASVTDLA